jgi:iron complex transport system ATP-binding protein
MTRTLLRLNDIALGYSGRPLYVDVNLTVGEGEMVVLLGANGAGKSTLLRCITGQLQPLSGRIEIDGCGLSAVTKPELARLVSIVRTDQTLAGGLTVREMVSLGRQPHTGFFGRLSQHDREVVDAALQSVGMLAFADREVASLSDGERQKSMIARAVAQETPLMVLDEPTAFLDVASRLETLQLLSDLAHNQHKAIILSSHDVSAALRLASRLWLIVECGDNQSDGAGNADTSGNTDSANSSPDSFPSRQLIDGTPAELIQSGAMERLFPDRNVAFNPHLLDFLPK